MKKSTEYLIEAIEKLGESSKAKAAERLKISRNTIVQYINGERIMDDFACIMVADVLGIQGMEIIAAAQMERETSEDRKRVWEDFRRKLGVMGVAGLMAVAMMGLPQQAKASEAGKEGFNKQSLIYYVKYSIGHDPVQQARHHQAQPAGWERLVHISLHTRLTKHGLLTGGFA
ncbi:helix-turn-helix domain-containing protein [Aquitalea magnusonii]|uniref:Uncharacterized protein n=1 Tax=Aquitalea magnusonii TaxID=332411 RepID=A0A318JKR5_9NEIS|nr:helix-turn-helix transcriptional regulator [Aquitalea magnusonii]PXX51205.1 hypothetical protein DFR38_101267 [Aquitalea magnusonii]